jgi:hypothetical protein
MLPAHYVEGNDIPTLQRLLMEWAPKNDKATSKVVSIIGFGYDDSTPRELRQPTREENGRTLDHTSRGDHPPIRAHGRDEQQGHGTDGLLGRHEGPPGRRQSAKTMFPEAGGPGGGSRFLRIGRQKHKLKEGLSGRPHVKRLTSDGMSGNCLSRTAVRRAAKSASGRGCV